VGVYFLDQLKLTNKVVPLKNGDLKIDDLPFKVRKPRKRVWKGERKCLVIAIQPLMHTCYVKFLDTGEIAVTPIRICERIKAIPKKKIIDYF